MKAKDLMQMLESCSPNAELETVNIYITSAGEEAVDVIFKDEKRQNIQRLNEVITFDTMPKAIAYLIGKIESLEKVVLSMGEVPSTPVDRWLDIYELSEYLPDHPKKQTIYGWVHTRTIPYHKGGKKLRFLQSEIDTWLSSGKRKSDS